jgi:hypothetical protein
MGEELNQCGWSTMLTWKIQRKKGNNAAAQLSGKASQKYLKFQHQPMCVN